MTKDQLDKLTEQAAKKFVLHEIIEEIKKMLFSAIDEEKTGGCDPFQMIVLATQAFEKHTHEAIAQEKKKEKPELRVVRPESGLH